MNIEAQAHPDATVRSLPCRLDATNAPQSEYAKRIQLSCVPSRFPAYPQRTEFDIYASLLPANGVDGDFYDFYLPEQNTLAFLIADVAGEGSAAALLAVSAKVTLRSCVESGMSIEEAFAAANRLLCNDSFSGLLATAWMGMLSLESGALRYVSAGHKPPLLRRKNGSFEFLCARSESSPLSRKDAKYQRNALTLLPGDEIFLYTDGLTGAENIGGQSYGAENLRSALNAADTGDARELCACVKADVRRFTANAPERGDMAMLCVRLNNLQTRDRIVIYPELASVSAIEDFLTRKMAEWQIAKKYANNVRIAIDEIYSNILRYSGATETQIQCRRGDALALTFTDNGKPYDPTRPEEPDEFAELGERAGGLGIAMVRSTTRSMAYSYEDGNNVLTLTFDADDRRRA